MYQSSRLQELIEVFNKYKFKIKIMKFVYNFNKKNSNVVLIKAVNGGKLGLEVEIPVIIIEMKVME